VYQRVKCADVKQKVRVVLMWESLTAGWEIRAVTVGANVL